MKLAVEDLEMLRNLEFEFRVNGDLACRAGHLSALVDVQVDRIAVFIQPISQRELEARESAFGIEFLPHDEGNPAVPRRSSRAFAARRRRSSVESGRRRGSRYKAVRRLSVRVIPEEYCKIADRVVGLP